MTYLPADGEPVDWLSENGHLVSSRGRIEPFNHPMVEVLATVDPDGRLGVAIVERPHLGHIAAPRHLPDGPLIADDSYDTFEHLRETCRSWQLHWFWIELDGESVRIEASRLPTVPVFVADITDHARCDWDPLNLYGFVEAQLDWDAAAHYICCFEQPYGTRTVIRQIKQVAAGYVAQWRPGAEWSFNTPEAAAPAYPRALDADAEPLRSLETMLNSALARLVPDRKVPMASALSGGFDSTCMAATCARDGRKTSTFGVVMDDEPGIAQRLRRNSVVELFALRDHAYPAAAPQDGDYGRTSRGRMVPWEELHHDMFQRIYRDAADTGHDLFLSGFGGDELVSLYWDELPDRDEQIAQRSGMRSLPDFLMPAVRSRQAQRTETMMNTPIFFAQRGVMDTLATVAAQHLRNGLWPIHLMATPEIVGYCHALPYEWRKERRLIRDLLIRWNVPDCVTQPILGESFSKVAVQALKQCRQAQSGLRVPRLVALGLVDELAANSAFNAWVEGVGPLGQDIHFIAMVVLDATLESLEMARRTRGINQ